MLLVVVVVVVVVVFHLEAIFFSILPSLRFPLSRYLCHPNVTYASTVFLFGYAAFRARKVHDNFVVPSFYTLSVARGSNLSKQNPEIRRWQAMVEEREATEKRRRTEETRELAEILVSAVDSPRRFNSFDVHEFAASSFRNASLSLYLAVIVVAVAAAP